MKSSLHILLLAALFVAYVNAISRDIKHTKDGVIITDDDSTETVTTLKPWSTTDTLETETTTFPDWIEATTVPDLTETTTFPDWTDPPTTVADYLRQTNEPEDSLGNSVSTTSIISTTAPPASEFKCAKVGRFTHPDGCEKYYYCWSTVHNYGIFTCPKVFDPKSQRCVENYAMCPLLPKCKADGHALPTPNNNQTYFVCKLDRLSYPDGEAVYEIRKEQCKEGRVFDAERGYCAPNISRDCEPTECERVGNFIDESSDTHYLKCEVLNIAKGIVVATRRKCPNETVFSAVDEQCVSIPI